jgi:cellulose synthase/poly-beta-1,6-N-acetylglucosamine synthase-like glycosyltransferase
LRERQFGKGKIGMMKGEGNQLTQNLDERSFQESPEFYSDFGDSSILNRSTVSIIIPAYNEEKT